MKYYSMFYRGRPQKTFKIHRQKLRRPNPLTALNYQQSPAAIRKNKRFSKGANLMRAVVQRHRMKQAFGKINQAAKAAKSKATRNKWKAAGFKYVALVPKKSLRGPKGKPSTLKTTAGAILQKAYRGTKALAWEAGKTAAWNGLNLLSQGVIKTRNYVAPRRTRSDNPYDYPPSMRMI